MAGLLALAVAYLLILADDLGEAIVATEDERDGLEARLDAVTAERDQLVQDREQALEASRDVFRELYAAGVRSGACGCGDKSHTVA
jgi:hypothetical protein